MCVAEGVVERGPGGGGHPAAWGRRCPHHTHLAERTPLEDLGRATEPRAQSSNSNLVLVPLDCPSSHRWGDLPLLLPLP